MDPFWDHLEPSIPLWTIMTITHMGERPSLDHSRPVQSVSNHPIPMIPDRNSWNPDGWILDPIDRSIDSKVKHSDFDHLGSQSGVIWHPSDAVLGLDPFRDSGDLR